MESNKIDSIFYERLDNVVKAYELLLSKLKIIAIIFFLSSLFLTISKKYIEYEQIKKIFIDLIHTKQGILWSTIIIFIIGIILTILKQKQQFWYGIFETIFSIVSCWTILQSVKENSEYVNILVLILSSLYIIVRGLSNINDGIKKDFWGKKDFLLIRENTLEFSKSQIKLRELLKDKEFIVKMLDILIRIAYKFT